MDAANPALWRKSYDLKKLECHVMARLQVGDTRGVARMLAEKMRAEETYESGRAVLFLSGPRSRFADTKKLLLSVGALRDYVQDCRDFPDSDYAELLFKRKTLIDERGKFAPALAGLPSLDALSKHELSDIEELIDDFDGSSTVRYQVELSTAENAAFSVRDRVYFSRRRSAAWRESDRKIRNLSLWRRSSFPTCTFVPASVFAVEPGAAFEKWKRVLSGKSVEYRPDGCDGLRLNKSADQIFWMRSGDVERIRRRADKAKELVRWVPDVPPPWSHPRVMTDAAKSSLLQSELTKSVEALAGAPGIRALASSEVERMAPTAYNDLESKDRKLVYLFSIRRP